MRSRESGDSTQPSFPRRRESTTIRNLQLPMRRDRSLCLSAIVDTRSDHLREGTETLPYDNVTHLHIILLAGMMAEPFLKEHG